MPMHVNVSNSDGLQPNGDGLQRVNVSYPVLVFQRTTRLIAFQDSSPVPQGQVCPPCTVRMSDFPPKDTIPSHRTKETQAVEPNPSRAKSSLSSFPRPSVADLRQEPDLLNFQDPHGRKHHEGFLLLYAFGDVVMMALLLNNTPNFFKGVAFSFVTGLWFIGCWSKRGKEKPRFSGGHMDPLKT